MNDDNRHVDKNCKVCVAAVSEEDIKLIKKVHKIVNTGKNVEIRKDKDGNLKLLQVSKEIV